MILAGLVSGLSGDHFESFVRCSVIKTLQLGGKLSLLSFRPLHSIHSQCCFTQSQSYSRLGCKLSLRTPLILASFPLPHEAFLCYFTK